MGIISDQYGYSSDAASLFGAVFIIGALIGSGIAGAYVETTRKYRFVTILLALLGSIFPIVLLFCLQSSNLALVCLGAFLEGSVLAILPIGIDFGVELTFPVPESISSGLLMTAAQIFGIILTISTTYCLG